MTEILFFMKKNVANVIAPTNISNAFTILTRETLYFSAPGLFRHLIKRSPLPTSISTPITTNKRHQNTINAISIFQKSFNEHEIDDSRNRN